VKCSRIFKNFVENQFDAKIKKIRSDNGTEFVNQNFTNLFKQKGILQLHTSTKWCAEKEKSTFT
jgi:CMP-N-acetylneuraminic acid synthetase